MLQSGCERRCRRLKPLASRRIVKLGSGIGTSGTGTTGIGAGTTGGHSPGSRPIRRPHACAWSSVENLAFLDMARLPRAYVSSMPAVILVLMGPGFALKASE